MTVRSILRWPDPRLSEECEDVNLGDLGGGVFPNRDKHPGKAKLKSMVRDLVDTLADAGGLGLAAPQIGWMKRVIAMADSRVLLEERRLTSVPVVVMVNPVLLSVDGEAMVRNEGCLSFPGSVVAISRQERCRVRWLTPAGVEVEHEFGEWDGRCVLHELEHLDGQTMLDHLSEEEREAFLLKVAKNGVE